MSKLAERQKNYTVLFAIDFNLSNQLQFRLKDRLSV